MTAALFPVGNTIKKGTHGNMVVLLDTVYRLFVFLQMFLHHVVLFLKIEGTITFHPSNPDIKRTVLLYPTLYMVNSLIYALKFPRNKNNTQYITRKPWLLKMFYQISLPCFPLFYSFTIFARGFTSYFVTIQRSG
jgi:hypothetical protein